jgi:hypothetical protein
LISENQRLERLAERLRAIEAAAPSPAAKIRAWNLVSAGLQKPAAGVARERSGARLLVAGLAASALLVAGAIAAAADSLPDSAFYPVKGTIENLEGAFALTAADQFKHHLTLAATRLREADAMFARHRVDLADQALVGMEDQLTSAAAVVKTVKASDAPVAGSLEGQLQQAVQTHDNQLAGLQGQVTNPTAVVAITRARNRAQEALKVAAAAADHGPGNGNGNSSASASSSDKGQSASGSPSGTTEPTLP